MGKNTKYPSFSGGSVSVNGNEVASVAQAAGGVNANYNMSDAEKSIYNYAQNSLASYLPYVNVFSPEVQNGLNSQLQAYQNLGMQSLNDLYTPILNNLKNDIASRFGNLNNSIFMDKLNNIERSRATALSDLQQNLLAQQSSLYNEELQRRYNYLNFMNNIQNQLSNNILNYIGAAQNNSSLGNSYNQNAYSANLNSTNSQWNRYMQAAQLAMRAAGQSI